MAIKKKYHCPVEASIDVIGGKWKPLILWHLSEKTMRFSELQATLPGITQSMLTKQLRELELNGIIRRKVYPQVPPKVEYSLTKSGKTVTPILDILNEWGEEHFGDSIEYTCDE